MKVRYYCYGCHRNKAVDVPTRTEAEDVNKWMEKVQQAIGDDHSTYAPNCKSQYCDVMMGVDEGKPIGDSENVPSPELISKVVRESDN